MGEVRDGKVRNSKKKRIQPIKNTKPTVEAPIPKPENIADKRINSPELLAELKGPNAHKLGFTMEKGAVKAPEYLRNAAYAVRDMKEKMPTGAVQQNQTGAPVSSPTSRLVMKQEAEDKPKTLSDYLSEQRKSLTKEKTDAAKMQKYYALTDALQALGKMGGAAIGGAIGGNALDSAPVVAEYQPSRGYVSAFEDAKKANERLRALDEKGYQLAVINEERSYNQQKAALDRKWQKEMVDYRNELERANAAEDFERSKKLKEEFAAKEAEYEKELLELRNKYSLQQTAASKANIQYQHDLYNKPIPIAFDNGTGIEISKSDYEGLTNYLIGKKIGGKTVSDDNLSIIIRENPNLVDSYLRMFGRSTVRKNTTKGGSDFVYDGTQFPANVSRPSESDLNGGAAEDNFDITQYERK